MATRKDIKETFHSECETVIGSNTAVTTADAAEHVGVADGPFEDRQPFLAFQDFPRPVERGFRGGVQVDHIEYNDSDEATAIVFRRDTRLRFDLTVVATGEVAKDELYAATMDHFGGYNRHLDPTDFHADASDVTVEESTPENREDSPAVGDTIRVYVEYGRFNRYTDFAPTRSIDTAIKNQDTNTVYDSQTYTN